MLELRLLGQFSIILNEQAIEIPSRPAQALLAYLVLNAGTPQSRERLAGLFWPDASEANARSSLRHALWRLRKDFSQPGTPEDLYLVADRYSITFAPQVECFIDIEILDNPVVEDTTLSDLMGGLNAYKGELLPGFYEDWVILERERLRAVFEKKANLLIERLLEQERFKETVEWAERWISHGQVPEPAYRALMIAHFRLGDLSSMAAAYQRCVKDLKASLELEPSTETRALYERLSERQQELSSPVQTAVAPKPLDASQPAVPAVRVPAFLIEGAAPGGLPEEIFVGRETELERLNGFLDQSLNKKGQLVFVIGEAGLGKTALVDEFARRIQGDQTDLVVAKGICSVYTGVGDPYLPFRDALAMLTGDVENEVLAGSVTREHGLRLWSLLPHAVQALVAYGPDLIDSLVSGRPLANRAQLHLSDGSSWLERLWEIIARNEQEATTPAPNQSRIFEEYTDVLSNLAAHRPLVLILEDLHWADPSSVGLLFHLGRRLREQRVLIVGTYRPEDIAMGWKGEQHPLEPVLSEFKRYYGDIWIDLSGKEPEAARAFIDNLLDAERNRLGDRFREKLVSTTGGHPMFATELLRDLRERGDLQRDEDGYWLESSDLSWDLMPLRVEAVIEKRIGRLDDELREVLSVASVEGETFTGEVIARILDRDERLLFRRLHAELGRMHRLIAEQRIQHDGHLHLSLYRFRHNLFQRYLYQSLSEGERRYLHEAIGLALEALYQEDADTIAVKLARHFEIGGIQPKAFHYLHEAGRRALEISANVEAIAHLRRAREFLQDLTASEGVSATPHPPGPSRIQRVRLERMLGEAYFGVGDLTESRRYLEAAVAMVGKPVPDGRRALLWKLGTQIIRQIVHRLSPLEFATRSDARRDLFREAAYIYKQLAVVYLIANDTLRLLYASLRNLNLAERAGPTPELARAYADMTALTPMIRLRRLAERYRQMAWQTADRINEEPVTAYVLLATSLYTCGDGRWRESNKALERANTIHERLSDWNNLGIGLVLAAHAHKHQGDLERAAALYEQLHRLAERSASLQQEAWATDGLAEMMIMRGGADELGEAIEMLERSQSLIHGKALSNEELVNHGLLATAYLRLGDPQKAIASARAASALIAKSPPKFFTLLEGYWGVAHVYLSLWESGSLESMVDPEDLGRMAKRACKDLVGFARIIQVGCPRAMLLQGCCDWLSGQPSKAQNNWGLGLQTAQRLGMPFDEARLYMEIGRHLAAEDPARIEHLKHARNIFEKIGALYYVQQTQASLSAGPHPS